MKYEPEPDDPLTAALHIAKVFELRGISYAIGGALAYGLWGVPRATIDVDINIFGAQEELSNVFDALTELGIVIDREQASIAAGRRGQFNAQFGMFRIDVFTPSIEFCREAERTRVRQTIDDQSVWFLSAESIAVFKLLFFRTKDIVDLQRLVAVQQQRLDCGYIRRHLVEMMGEDDERVVRWDKLLADHVSSES
jgi:hypothetical protein